MPRSKGGSDDPDNLAWACMGCTGIKYNDTSAIDPITMETVPLYNPRTQNWSEHFQWQFYAYACFRTHSDRPGYGGEIEPEPGTVLSIY